MKKALQLIRDCVEKYIPMAAFVVLFVLFCFQILARYGLAKVMNITVPWTVEIEQMCFLWVVMLGACYVQRCKGHVVFTLVYDMLKPRGKALVALLGNLLIAFTFAMTVLPSLRWVWGLMARHQVTSLLKIPKTVAFFPYCVFVVIILIYALLDVYEDLMALLGNQNYLTKLINESKSETELAVEAAQAQKAKEDAEGVSRDIPIQGGHGHD